MNKKTRLSSFTFQYVSINTKEPAKDMGEICTLHSNMFLLILGLTEDYQCADFLYIPICFY